MLSALVSANGLKNEIYSCVVRLFREESYNRKNRNNRRIVPSRKIGESEESYLKTHFLLFSDLTIIAPFWMFGLNQYTWTCGHRFSMGSWRHINTDIISCQS